MSNNQVSTYKTGGAPTEKSFRPSEFGRVSAWVKTTKNDLALVKDMYGHPPSIAVLNARQKSSSKLRQQIHLQDTPAQNEGMLTLQLQTEHHRSNEI
jgi:hypothetical protein